MITIRERLQDELDHLGETWSDIETLGVTEEMLDRQVGELEHGDPVAWTRSHVVMADTDSDWCEFLVSVPRNPPANFQPIQPLPEVIPSIDGPLGAAGCWVEFVDPTRTGPVARERMWIPDPTFGAEHSTGDAA